MIGFYVIITRIITLSADSVACYIKFQWTELKFSTWRFNGLHQNVPDELIWEIMKGIVQYFVCFTHFNNIFNDLHVQKIIMFVQDKSLMENVGKYFRKIRKALNTFLYCSSFRLLNYYYCCFNISAIFNFRKKT